MVDAASFEPDADRSRACADCGWHGPETAMRGAAAGDAVGPDLACPRCGAPSAPDLPTIAQILAARRTALPDA